MIRQLLKVCIEKMKFEIFKVKNTFWLLTARRYFIVKFRFLVLCTAVRGYYKLNVAFEVRDEESDMFHPSSEAVLGRKCSFY